MEEFAKSKSLDPLLPETWYKISPKEFLQLKVIGKEGGDRNMGRE
jgi:hypothetical protein